MAANKKTNNTTKTSERKHKIIYAHHDADGLVSAYFTRFAYPKAKVRFPDKFGDAPKWKDGDIMVDMKPIDQKFNGLCLSGDTYIIFKTNGKIRRQPICQLQYMKPDTKIEVLYNGLFIPAKYIRLPCPDNLLQIKLYNGTTIKVTEDHKFLTDNGIKSAIELTNDDKLPFALYGYDGTGGTYYLGRFIGLYFAEGSISGKSNNHIQFGLHIDEVDLRDFIHSFVNDLGYASNEYMGHGQGVTISCKSKTLADLINEYVKGTAINKTLTSKVFSMSTAFRIGLLDGVYEGDGRKSRNNIDLRTKQGITDLADLAISVGKLYSVRHGYVNYTNELGKECIVSRINMLQDTFINGLYNSANQYFIRDGDYNWCKVRSIERVGKANNQRYVYCFNVNTDEHLFQLSNGVITHNCIDHHPGHGGITERKYKLIFDEVPASLLCWREFKDKIPKEEWWKAAIGVNGDVQPETLPYEIWKLCPQLLDNPAFKISNFWSKQEKQYVMSTFHLPLYKRVSSALNTWARVGEYGKALDLLKESKSPLDLVQNTEMLKQKKENIKLYNKALGTAMVHDFGYLKLVLFESYNIRLSGWIASAMVKERDPGTVLAINTIDGRLSLRGELATFYKGDLEKLNCIDFSGHGVAMGGKLKGDPNDLVEALRKKYRFGF